MDQLHRVVLTWIRQAKFTLNSWLDDLPIANEDLVFESQIAKGASGFVYHTKERNTGKSYVVKIADSKSLGPHNEEALKKLKSGKKAVYAGPKCIEWKVVASAKVNCNVSAARANEVRNHLSVIRTGHPNVVDLVAFASNHNAVGKKGYILLLEYCNLGDLHGMLDQFLRRSFVIPEFFIWRVFEALLSAVAWLHKEHPDYHNDIHLRSRPILLHGDINLPNVMLALDDTDVTAWPTVKLGDFDGGVPLWDDSEQVDFSFGKDESNPPEYPKRSTKGDVWGVGATIHALCHDGYGPVAEPARPHVRPVGPSVAGKQMWALPPHYSIDLEEAIGHALAMDAKDRWSAKDLLAHVTKHIDDHGLRKDPRPVPEWLRMEPRETLNSLSVGASTQGVVSDEGEEPEDRAGGPPKSPVKSAAAVAQETQGPPQWGGPPSPTPTQAQPRASSQTRNPTNQRKRNAQAEDQDNEDDANNRQAERPMKRPRKAYGQPTRQAPRRTRKEDAKLKMKGIK